jgi:hypothetical protein
LPSIPETGERDDRDGQLRDERNREKGRCPQREPEGQRRREPPPADETCRGDASEHAASADGGGQPTDT